MAQKARFSEDQLMDAVVRYSETHHGKIKVSDLARWASKNISGMEGVQAHNFRAKRKAYNSRTGKPEERELEAFSRIQELNRIRAGTGSAGQNVFLHASDPDAYLRLPKAEQRRQILEARSIVETANSKHKDILRQNVVVQEENKRLKEENCRQDRLLAEIQKKQEALDRQLRMVIREIDENGKAEILRTYGVMDGGFDLVAYQASLRQDIRDAFSISDAIKRFTKRHAEEDEGSTVPEDNDRQSQIDSIIGGLEI